MSDQNENRYNRHGQISAAVVLALALVFFVWNIFSKQTPPPPLEGFEVVAAVAAGDPDMGNNDDENPLEEEEIEEVVEEEAEPEPVPAEEPEVITDDNSDAPPIKTKPKVKPEPKKPEVVKKPKPKPKRPKATFKNKKGKKGAEGKGDNKNPGSTGEEGGSGDAKVGSVTTGGDIGGGLSGRGVRSRSKPVNNTGQFGKVVIKICVDKDGNVLSATFTQGGSTNADGDLVRLAEKAAKAYKFQGNPNAPDKQCGTVTFRFLPG